LPLWQLDSFSGYETNITEFFTVSKPLVADIARQTLRVGDDDITVLGPSKTSNSLKISNLLNLLVNPYFSEVRS